MTTAQEQARIGLEKTVGTADLAMRKEALDARVVNGAMAYQSVDAPRQLNIRPRKLARAPARPCP